VLFAFNDVGLREYCLPIGLFGMVAALAWLLLNLAATGKPRALERLDELKNPRARRPREASALKKRDRVTSMLERATPALAKPLTPKNEKELSNLRVKLANAGFRSESAGSVYLGLKLVGLVFGLLVATGTVAGFIGLNAHGVEAGVVIVATCFYLPSVIVSLLARSRKQAIFLALPDALDLMVVCVEAGLGLDQAMRRVADEMKRTYRVLADEFALSNFQLQMGRPRAEVLHELGVRTGVSDLRALAGVLIQADKFGSSVAQALRVQSDSQRLRRRQLAEEKAAKTAVQLIFPLVLFIFPGIFVVLVGPAAITIVREMFPMMAGGG
jgi:tight adherence protein C